MTPPGVRPWPEKVCTTSVSRGPIEPKDRSQLLGAAIKPRRPVQISIIRFDDAGRRFLALGDDEIVEDVDDVSIEIALEERPPRSVSGEVQQSIRGLEDPAAGLLRDRVGVEVVELRMRPRARQAKQRAAVVGAAERRRAVEVPVARLHQSPGRLGAVGPGKVVERRESPRAVEAEDRSGSTRTLARRHAVEIPVGRGEEVAGVRAVATRKLVDEERASGEAEDRAQSRSAASGRPPERAVGRLDQLGRRARGRAPDLRSRGSRRTSTLEQALGTRRPSSLPLPGT